METKTPRAVPGRGEAMLLRATPPPRKNRSEIWGTIVTFVHSLRQLAICHLPLAIFVAPTRLPRRSVGGGGSRHIRPRQDKTEAMLPHSTPIALCELNVHDATSITPPRKSNALMA